MEPELLPCALNLLKRKRKDDADEIHVEQMTENDGKPENLQLKECNNKINKSKVVSNNKKKLKCMKNLEACLELLESNTSVLKEKREQGEYSIRIWF